MRREHGALALQGSAVLWFSVAAVGHALFVFYVIRYYGVNLLASGVAWLDKTPLTGGYVAADPLGNLAAVAHVILAILIHGGGPLQMIPAIRSRAPRFHHWNGRAFLAAAIVSSMTGLYLHFARGAGQGWLDVGGNVANSALIFLFAAVALRHAMARNISAHRRWALRLFFAASAVWFIRLGMYGTKAAAPTFGIEYESISEPLLMFMTVAKLAVPLGMLELYFWTSKQADKTVKLGVTALILLMTAVTAVGIYGAATIRWLPRIYE